MTEMSHPFPVCEFCGGPDAVWQPDPYANDVDNDPTPHWICEECCAQLADDI